MPRTNTATLRGFQPLNAQESDYVVMEVASGYATDIYPGDPVIALNTGYIARTPAGSNSGAAVDGMVGVCTEIIQYKDPAGFLRKNAKYYPASTSYSAHQERTLVKVCLANEAVRFRVLADTAFANVAALITGKFNNVDHKYSGADQGLGLSGAQLNMSTIATTNTLQWRFLEALDIGYSDPTAVNFTAVVTPNLIYGLPVVGHSTTGV